MLWTCLRIVVLHSSSWSKWNIQAWRFLSVMSRLFFLYPEKNRTQKNKREGGRRRGREKWRFLTLINCAFLNLMQISSILLTYYQFIAQISNLEGYWKQTHLNMHITHQILCSIVQYHLFWMLWWWTIAFKTVMNPNIANYFGAFTFGPHLSIDIWAKHGAKYRLRLMNFYYKHTCNVDMQILSQRAMYTITR